MSNASACHCCHKDIISESDMAGDHALCCVKSGYVRRHYILCNQVRYLLTSATTSEEYLDQLKTLRVDLVAVNFAEGASDALDISITHSLALARAVSRQKVLSMA